MKQNKVQNGKIGMECDYKDMVKKIQELALTIDEVEDEKQVVENQLKRALSDYHNLLTNSEKRQKISFFQMKKSLAENLLPSLDALKLAVESSKELVLDSKGKAWLEGVLATSESIEKALERIGLKIYLPEVGDIFDSSIHEALATVKGSSPGCISEVIQPGYMLDDTVIRDAKVIVTK